MRFSIPALRRGTAALAALGLFAAVSCDTPPTPPPDPSTARLISCPSTETRTTQALIGPLGGTLSLGATTIGIPSGALSVPTFLTLTIPAGQYMEVDVKANNLPSFTFNKTVAIRIDYSRCTDPALATARLNVWHIDAQSKELLEFMGGSDDKAAKTVTFTTGHLSAYAVAF